MTTLTCVNSFSLIHGYRKCGSFELNTKCIVKTSKCRDNIYELVHHVFGWWADKSCLIPNQTLFSCRYGPWNTMDWGRCWGKWAWTRAFKPWFIIEYVTVGNEGQSRMQRGSTETLASNLIMVFMCESSQVSGMLIDLLDFSLIVYHLQRRKMTLFASYFLDASGCRLAWWNRGPHFGKSDNLSIEDPLMADDFKRI